MKKRVQRHRLVTNQPTRQNVRKVHDKRKPNLIKPYGKRAPA